MPAEAKGFDPTPRVPDLDPIEIASRDEIAALQLSRLQWSLDHAYQNVPHYRRAIRVGEEPLDLFRRYMAVYCREQAYCHFSPALIANLEKHWNAAQRKI
jgi:hypothetical protein